MTTAEKPGHINKMKNVIRQFHGKLTDNMHLHPSHFGLGKLPSRIQPDAVTSAVCGFCSTGCTLNLHVKNNQAINVTPSNDSVVNFGLACPKGWEALTPLKSTDRGMTPLMRTSEGLKPCDWDTALKVFCNNFKEVQEKHGKESVAFLSTGQIPFEEMALLGAVAKFGMGVVHGDGNTRQCMASAAVAYKQSFGFDAPPYTYADFELSDTLVFVGANPCISHPIMWHHVCKNKNNPNIIVIDPRKTETATAATHHYDIQPKSDLALFYCLANLLDQKGYIDKEFIEKNTNEYDDFRVFFKDYTLERAVRETGMSEDKILELVELIHSGKRVSFWWTMGVNQGHQGTKIAQSLINLALMTGNIGKEGTGANSITGQTNAMGSRIFSNTTGLFAGRDFQNVQHRQEISELMNIPIENIPDRNSLPYHKILEGIEEGTIKGLWVVATNPGHSWIQRKEIKKLFSKLDYLVVQDMYMNTDTIDSANLFLPAAGWGEKDGVVINSERRLGLYKKTNKAPGLAMADFYIFKLIAEYWGCGELFKEWSSPEAAFQVMKKISKGTPCDFSGIKDYAMINAAEGIQWPFPEGSDVNGPRQRRLFEDGKFYHRDQKAKFLFTEHVEPTSKITEEFPIIMLTGRGTSAQWHTGTRTSKSEILKKLYPKEIYVEINPEDAIERRIVDGEKVEIKSEHASIQAHAYFTPRLNKGQVFVAMHYFEANKLTHASFCPDSSQPSYKYTAVNINKII